MLTYLIVIADACSLILAHRAHPADPHWLEKLIFLYTEVVLDELEGRGDRKSFSPSRRSSAGRWAAAFFLEHKKLAEAPISIDVAGMGRVMDLKRTHRIGTGEASCILAAESLPYPVLTDDAAASRAAVLVLGKDRVMSTFDLVFRAYQSDVIDLDWIDRAVVRLREDFVDASEWPGRMEQYRQALDPHIQGTDSPRSVPPDE